ncbi:hypothetical protein Q428_08760 [Fervidicella metallireducens AeB]|uniref:Uncharacterized protein n=1 Tax=Fervidicella metallireducens AeB TaxID=1403537 RepID=A0A017RUI0_9CLOT|nr:hypothetical protein [Fervidicella metallireducens]EYE88281.1 hypothetical protein Q428_08760 [Fervidicella metallireducens AeB]
MDKEIKVGVMVSYKHTPSMQIRKGKVIALAKIIDCKTKMFVGKTIAYVEYDRGSIPDEIFIEDVTLI